MADNTVIVPGLSELERAFKAAGPLASREIRLALREIGEPVARDAEQLARSNIRRIGVPWSEMRVGVTTHAVYVAPKQRGVKSRTDRRFRRPNLFDLLMGRSLEPALERNVGRVEAAVDSALTRVAHMWETV